MQRRASGLFVALGLAALCATVEALAQSPHWVPLGPDGGDVTAMVVDPTEPTRIFAGLTQAGVYLSEDGGATWRRANNGLDGYYVHALAAAATDPLTLYAGTDAGLFRSTDNAASWSVVPTNLTGPEAGISAVGIDPSNASIIIVGSNVSRIGENTMLQRTENGGTDWSSVALPVQEASVRTIAFSPHDATQVFVGTGCCGGGVFRSNDRGLLFADASEGLASSLIETLAFDPDTDGVLWVGTGLGLHLSTNGGDLWAPHPTGLPSGPPEGLVHTLVIDPATPGRIFASIASSVYRSNNGGDAWEDVSNGLTASSIASMTVTSVAPQRIFVGTMGRAVYRSDDGGDHWMPSAAGMSSARIQAITIRPDVEDTVWIGTSADGQRSEDGGATWRPLGLDGAVAALAFDPVNTDTAYAIAGGVLMKTTDGGAQWSAKNSGLPESGVQLVVVASARPATVFVAACGYGVFRSDDGAENWTALAGETADRCVQSLAVDPNDADIVFASAGGGWENDTMLFSSNGGDSFSRIENGLPGDLIPGSVAIEAGPPRRAYLGFIGDSGLYTTTDDGATWLPGGGVPGSIRRLVVDESTTTVWAATSSGVFRSFDHGAFWVDETYNLPNVSAERLALGAGTNPLYLGTGADGLFVLEVATQNGPDAGVDDAGVGDASADDGAVDGSLNDGGQSDRDATPAQEDGGVSSRDAEGDASAVDGSGDDDAGMLADARGAVDADGMVAAGGGRSDGVVGECSCRAVHAREHGDDESTTARSGGLQCLAVFALCVWARRRSRKPS
ncbi:MAG: hypothetical protein IPK13_02355 [Deltaproteobacteria bacterium]|nr:hypothetical protein [Deltaproteobacteria bacterium]